MSCASFFIIFCVTFVIVVLGVILSVYFLRGFRLSNKINYIHPFDSNPIDHERSIPRIIHQTYISENVPLEWKYSQQSVKFWNDGFEYIFWTDETLRTFINENYPNFINTYDSYPYAIQRVDAARYFLLYHFGGFYLDLDIGCHRSLEDLRAYQAILPKTEPLGFSNDFMASSKRHPFFRQLTNALSVWNVHLGLPDLTVLVSTGPLFLTNQYHSALPSTLEGVKTLPHSLYAEKSDLAYFYHVQGSTWHRLDAAFFNALWFDGYLNIFVTVIICALFGYYLWKRRSQFKRRQ